MALNRRIVLEDSEISSPAPPPEQKPIWNDGTGQVKSIAVLPWPIDFISGY
jgi:hypothetical protein